MDLSPIDASPLSLAKRAIRCYRPGSLGGAWEGGHDKLDRDRGVGRCKILGRPQVQVARPCGGGLSEGDVTPSNADKIENSTLNEAI